jgi:hypothetical protein
VTSSVMLKFAFLCLAVADAHEAPTSLAITLYPIFRKNVNKITGRLIYDVGQQGECVSGHERDGVEVRGPSQEVVCNRLQSSAIVCNRLHSYVTDDHKLWQ